MIRVRDSKNEGLICGEPPPIDGGLWIHLWGISWSREPSNTPAMASIGCLHESLTDRVGFTVCFEGDNLRILALADEIMTVGG